MPPTCPAHWIRIASKPSEVRQTNPRNRAYLYDAPVEARADPAVFGEEPEICVVRLSGQHGMTAVHSSGESVCRRCFPLPRLAHLGRGVDPSVGMRPHLHRSHVVTKEKLARVAPCLLVRWIVFFIGRDGRARRLMQHNCLQGSQHEQL